MESAWEKNKTFDPEFCCYRYVEGLRADDPPDLVLLYFQEPTYWECSKHKQRELGRPVCLVGTVQVWEFLPEAEFQRRLAQTAAFVQARTSGQ